jgi:hypothetical protein
MQCGQCKTVSDLARKRKVRNFDPIIVVFKNICETAMKYFLCSVYATFLSTNFYWVFFEQRTGLTSNVITDTIVGFFIATLLPQGASHSHPPPPPTNMSDPIHLTSLIFRQVSFY